MKKEYIATFQVKFNPDLMCDEETIKKEFGGSWDRFMKWMIEEDGIGIFDKDFEFIRVIK